MGHEAQRKMAVSSVLIVGLNGLGVEVAKNVILAGVKSVTVYDDKAVSYDDLASQFYLTEADIGKNRAVVSAPKLAELNPYVHVSLLNGALSTADLLNNYTVVVLIDLPLDKQIEVADFCHQHNIHVVIGDVRGVFGNVFCDFGRQFQVHDVNGEPISSSMIASVTMDAKALVSVLEDTRHNLETGDVVAFSEVAGMTELNGRQCRVTVRDPFSFEIEVDSREFTPYERGGYVNQVKQTVAVDFDSFSQSLRSPGEIQMDFVKFDHAAPLHLAFQALHGFQAKHGQLPTPGSRAHAQELFDLCVSMNSAVAEDGAQLRLSDGDLAAQEGLIKRLAMCSRGLVAPMCALLGGIMGQEVLKACSGKFMPIKQWFYFDAVEALSDEPLPQEEVAPQGNRYDGQVMVFGKALQSKLANLSMFLVGAGAIGCEMIKNWAMMGVACHPSGSPGGGTVYVTDMDQIEKSNLSRQFLFRNTDINCPKSTTAVRAVKTMNPEFVGTAYESKVAPETEGFFNDDFFEALDMVCTALDNVEARLYIDQKCLFYHKPMLESGTLGAKGHTQVVVPFKTENYGATRDPPEKSIPVCTLKHFPNQIDHTLQWAREWFEEVYRQTPEDVTQYLTNPDYLASLASQQNMRLDTLSRVRDAIVTKRPRSIEDCLVWARHVFEDLFSSRIKQLLHNFPLDRCTATGALFWSGAKKPPAVITFDLADPLHLEFILSAANMRALNYAIAPTSDVDVVRAALDGIVLEQFRPADGVKIAATDEEAKAEAESRAVQMHVDIDQQCADVASGIPPAASLRGSFAITAVDFDKDVDAHMRVVAAVSNLRARNYRIPEADLHTSRGIAGKITPAIATTTALVTGAICLELYKIVQDKPASKLVNSFTNLALPMFTSMEPEPPKATVAQVRGKEWRWTQWDRIDIAQPDMTIEQLIAHLEEEYGVELSMLSTGVTILYSDFMDRKKMKERKTMPLRAVVEAVTKKVSLLLGLKCTVVMNCVIHSRSVRRRSRRPRST